MTNRLMDNWIVSEFAPLTWPSDIDAAQLPKVRDRLQAASMFFDVKLPAHLAIQGLTERAHRWMSWGSLAALASALEVAELELAELNLSDSWRRSKEREDLLNSALFGVVKELRNYESHIGFLERWKDGEGIHMRGFRFSSVDFAELQKLRNISQGRSPVNEEKIEEFNTIARRYTTEGVVQLCANELASSLLSYVNRQKIKGN